MPTIEELEAQVAEAEQAKRDAHARWLEATATLQGARNEASGIIGHVLEFQQAWGNRPMKRIVVDHVRKDWRGDSCAHGYFVLKDGRVGLRRGETAIDKAKDLGPYVASTKEQTR